MAVACDRCCRHVRDRYRILGTGVPSATLAVSACRRTNIARTAVIGIVTCVAVGLAGRNAPPIGRRNRDRDRSYRLQPHSPGNVRKSSATPLAYWTDATRDSAVRTLAHVNLGSSTRRRHARRWRVVSTCARSSGIPTPQGAQQPGVVLGPGRAGARLRHFVEETQRASLECGRWFNLGIWYETHNNHAEARRHYERARQLGAPLLNQRVEIHERTDTWTSAGRRSSASARRVWPSHHRRADGWTSRAEIESSGVDIRALAG